jgi:hypothetical protein
MRKKLPNQVEDRPFHSVLVPQLFSEHELTPDGVE